MHSNNNLFLKFWCVIIAVVFCLGAFTANAFAEIIIDNDDAGTTYSGGPWGYSSGASPYDGSSRAESLGGALYTFQGPVTGAQTVSLWWTYWSSRCASVPVDIYDGTQLLATVLVNQNQQGLAGQWNVLGTYSFTSTARVVIRAQSGCSACADAVKFADIAEAEIDYVTIQGPVEITENESAQYTLRAYYTNGTDQLISADSWEVSCSTYAAISATGLLSAGGVIEDEACMITASFNDSGTLLTDTLNIVIKDNAVPAELIIDNDDAGTSYSGGSWGYSSGASPYDGSSRAESLGGASYTFQGAVTGAQTVSIWWTYWSSRCASVPVDIYNGTQLLATVLVNQKQQDLAGQWNVLGTYSFTGTARVVIRAQSGCSACADAVKFHYIQNYYVCVGDSITYGFGDDDPTDDISLDGRNSGGGYEPILNDLLTDMTGESHIIVNEGVESATSSYGRTWISAILATHPNSHHFLVQWGTNDARPWLPVPSGIGLSADDDGYQGTFKDNMQQIIDAINAAGKEVCLAKPPITLGDGINSTPYVDPDLGERSVLIKEYNEVIDELKNDFSNNIVVTPPDFYNLFNEDVPGGKRYDFEYSDNLHPNGDGYRSMAERWFESLTP